MRFWRCLSAVAVLGLFYVGHGLHQRQGPMPWEQPALGVYVHPEYSPWVDGLAPAAATQSADGRTIYFWGKSLDPKLRNPGQGLKIWSAAGDQQQ